VAAVDVTDEGRMDVVAEELLEADRQRRHHAGGHGEDVVLDRP
jgi:hypothetical protein